jgi:hypothetical protein
MVQRRKDLGFALKPPKALRVGGKFSRQDLQCDIPLQPRITCAIDLSL